MRGVNHHEDWSWSNAPRKGGGTNTVTQQSGPPQQILNELQQAYGQGQQVSQQPYPTYGGSQLAGFQPQQEAGFNNINTAVNAGQPFLNAASQDATNATGLLDPSSFGGNVGAYQNQGLAPYLGQAGNQVNAALNYSQGAATNLNGANFGQTIGGYYNPYAQSVIAPTEAQFANTNAQQLNQVRGNAAAQGAFGGDREAVAEAQTAGQQQTAEAPVIAGLESSGYQQAVANAMQSEQQQQQTAQTLLGASGQTAAQGNLQQQGFNAATSAAQADAWLNSQGSFAMGNLGQEAQTLGLQGANAQIGAGSLQQQQAQQELNIPYQQFQAAQGYPYQMTNWLEGLATGTAGMSGSQGSTTSPSPSIASQIGGLGLTGIGAYGLLNNAGLLSGMGGAAGAGAGALSTAGLSSLIDAGGGLGELGAVGGALALAAKGGRIDHDKLRALHSLRRDIVMPRRDDGGAVSPMINPGAPIGSPMASNLYSRYASLPTEQLQELAVRAPQNPMIQRAIQMRRMTPQADPSQQQPQQAQPGLGAPQQPQPQQMQAAPGGFGDGGEIERDTGGDIPGLPLGFDSLAPLMGMGASSDPSTSQPSTGPPTPYEAFGARRAEAFRPHRAPGPTPDMQPITDENTGSWQDSAPALGQTAGVGPPPPSPEGSGYADFRPAAGFGPQNYPMPSTGVPPPAPHHVAAAAHHPQAQQPPQTVGGLGPQSPEDTAQMATHTQDAGGEQGATPSHTSNFMATPSGMLLAAGLGILGGRSPFASVNIGEGGLKGLELGEQAQQRQQQMESNNLYRSALINNRGQQLDINRDRQGTNDFRAQATAAYQQGRLLVANGTLTERQMQDRFNDGLNTGKFDFTVAHAGVQSAQRQATLDQGDARLQEMRRSHQANEQSRSLLMQNTNDQNEKKRIAGMQNADLSGFTRTYSAEIQNGAKPAEALQRAQRALSAGREQAGQDIAPAPATSAGQQRPSLSSLLPP